MRLVAIVSHLQKQGHGTVLMERVEILAASLCFNQLLVHAAPDAVDFYQKLGFSRFDFDIADIQSVQLRKLI